MRLKKNVKKRILKTSKGIISIFLCILMTPILTLSCTLIEFSRYQGATSTAQGIMDASIVSTLANYDKYLEERFGLMALSQDIDIETVYKELLGDNSKLLGNALQTGTGTTAKGENPFSENDILKQQLLDYSENTVLMEVLLEDLNLQDLLDKLQSMLNFDQILNGVTAVADATSAIKNVVVAIDEVITAVENAAQKITDLKAQVKKTADSVATLFQNVKNNEAVKNGTVGATDENPGTAFDINNMDSMLLVAENFVGDIKTIYQNVNDSITMFNDAKTTLEAIPDKMEAVGAAISNAKRLLTTSQNTNKSALDEVKNSVAEEGTSEEEAEQSDDVLGEILSTLETAYNDTMEDFNNNLEGAFDNAGEIFKQKIIESIGLPSAVTDGTFALDEDGNLTVNAQNILKKLFEEFPENWDYNNPTASLNTLKTALLDMFVPDILEGDIVQDIKTALVGAKNAAEQALENAVQDAVGNMLSALVNAVKNLFQLNVFYDPDLCAYVSVNDSIDNPFQDMLRSIESLVSAYDSFVNGHGLKEKLQGFVDLFESVKSSYQAIVSTVNWGVSLITDFVNVINNPQLLYEKLLLCGYCTHNLPNRTHAQGSYSISVNEGWGIETNYVSSMTGAGLTGFPYNKILVPNRSADNITDFGIGHLISKIMETNHGGEYDPVFCGAELEYIMAGTSSEIANQIVAFMEIYLVRLLLDMPAVFLDSGVAAMASATGPFAWLVYLIVLLAEPLVDTILLVNGSEAPLVKTRCYLSPKGIPIIIDKLANLTFGNENIAGAASDKIQNSLSGKLDAITDDSPAFTDDGSFQMGYDTHCLILLLLLSVDEGITRRLKDIIGLEASYYYQVQGSSFDINKTFTTIDASTEMTFNPFIDMFEFGEDGTFTADITTKRGY